MSFLKILKERVKAWLAAKYSAGSVKASSLWANAIALVVGALPDLINFGLNYFDLITTGLLPTLSPENKANFLLFMNFAALVLRMYKQNSVQKASLKQAAEQGRITSSQGTEAIVIRSAEGSVEEVVLPASATEAP